MRPDLRLFGPIEHTEPDGSVGGDSDRKQEVQLTVTTGEDDSATCPLDVVDHRDCHGQHHEGPSHDPVGRGTSAELWPWGSVAGRREGFESHTAPHGWLCTAGCRPRDRASRRPRRALRLPTFRPRHRRDLLMACQSENGTDRAGRRRVGLGSPGRSCADLPTLSVPLVLGVAESGGVGRVRI